MKSHHRLIRAALVALLVAAAWARADLGADTEASVLQSRAFLVALPGGAVAGWFGAAVFGLPGLRGWALSVAVIAAAVAAGALGVAAIGGDLAALAAQAIGQPLALGSLAAAVLLPRLMAWRQSRG